jgi:hypothetical protein
MKYVINKSKLNAGSLLFLCSKDGDFTVYKYPPNPSTELYNYRSIITHDNKVVCFSPPKSIDQSYFLELYSSKDVVVEEYIEGTMVNLFWVNEEIGWKIASRSKINASCAFFDTNGEFSIMANETFSECMLDLNALNKGYCYSFVMQHPGNRIVTKFETHALYLIAAYKIENDCENENEICVFSIDDIQSNPVWATTRVKFPATILDFNLQTDPNTLNMPYTQMGVVFKSEGARCKLRNPAYEHVRQLRGNQPKLLYRYLELRKSGKTSEYLKYYPEHSDKFSQFRSKIHAYTNTLYNLYVSVHILKKEVSIEDRNDKRFKISLNKLHEIYLTQQLKINITRVIAYVNSLPEAVLMTIV